MLHFDYCTSHGTFISHNADKHVRCKRISMAQKFVSESVSLILMYLYVDRQQKERVRHEKISTHCLHQSKIDR